jgi:hypothetical protein
LVAESAKFRLLLEHLGLVYWNSCHGEPVAMKARLNLAFASEDVESYRMRILVVEMDYVAGHYAALGKHDDLESFLRHRKSAD